MLLSFQKEVAKKIVASVGQANYGFLSVLVQSFWKVKCVLNLHPQDFYPRPKIQSQVLLFEQNIKPNHTPRDRELFLQFLKKAFTHTRKLLANNLINCETCLEKMNLNPKIRAHQLSCHQFHELYELYQSLSTQ